jgi:DnaK suppressor protein
MNKKQLTEVKNKLSQMKITMEESILSIQQEAKVLEENAQDMDSFDISANNSEMNRLKNIRDQKAKQLEQIKSALVRVNTPMFGVCITCEEDIPEKRLLSNPLCSRCLECQEDVEREQKRMSVGGRASIISDDESKED